MGEDVCPPNASKSKNANPSSRNIGLTPDDQHRMAELYADGQSCHKIADLFGCSSSNVSYSLRKLGVKMRPPANVSSFSKEKHRQIVQFYEAGQSCYDLAEQFGCSADNIRLILQKHDVKMRPRNSPAKFSEDISRRMADLYKQGHSRRSIAARFGCDPTTLNRVLNEQGMEIPPAPSRHFVTQAECEMIVKLYHQGLSHSEIATKIGCVPQTIGKILRKLNIPIRVQGPDAYSDEDQQKMADLYKIGISTVEIAVGFDCTNRTVLMILQKHGVKIRPLGFKGQVPPKKREKILTMYKEGFSGVEIAAKFECSLETVASVIELATRKSQIVQRISSMSNANAVDDPGEDTESPVVETPPSIPLESLVRDFWADKARAIDVLLLPPDIRLKIMESVEQALFYAWNTLGQRQYLVVGV